MKAGWQTKTLGDIADIKGGKRVPKGYKLQSAPTKYPYITVSDFTDDGTIDKSDLRYVNGEIFEQIKRYTISSKDLYLSIAGTIGKTGYVPPELDGASLTENACKLVLRPNIDRDFVYYFTKSDEFTKQAGTNTRTAAQPKLALERLKTIKLQIPESLPEQQRIVGILDSAFDGIATAKANAEKNLQNARALFESHLQSVFTQRGEGWVDAKLEDVCGFQNGFAFKSSNFRETGSPILRISNIQDGQVDLRRLVFFDPKEYRENLDRYRIVQDDLLIAMSGATTGKLGFNTESTVFYLNQRVGKFEPGKKLNKRYLYHFLSTKVEENLRISAGSAQPNLSTEQIKGFVLPLPNIDEQARIVDALERLSEETQRLESLYRRKLAALDELKKSLLHQAFSGAL